MAREMAAVLSWNKTTQKACANQIIQNIDVVDSLQMMMMLNRATDSVCWKQTW
jgi:hypothetical protein